MQKHSTLGRYIARRLVQVGVGDVFSVPGDFNLTLLDHVVEEPGLNLVGCCNELNAGYAAHGYARARGVGACVVTFTVGGLSVLNAIAAAYGDDAPVICIVGGPNSNDLGTNRILHHTIGLPDFSQELRCFQTITCFQAAVNNVEDAPELIDRAISTCLKQSKPVYISVSCNLPAIPHPAFRCEPVPFSLSPRLSNKMGLEAAVEASAAFLNKALSPVLVAGPKLRLAKACESFVELADSCSYPLAVMPSAKGLVPEHHPRFIGTYCANTEELEDAYLFAGPSLNDLSYIAESFPLVKKEQMILLQPDRVVVANGPAFGCVLMEDFLLALAKKLEPNSTAFDDYQRNIVPRGNHPEAGPKEALKANVLFGHIENMLSSENVVVSEGGDYWLEGQNMKLPEGCGYEIQMQYSSLGWSVGATLGYAQAVPEKRLITCIGGRCFQMTFQDVSTMLRSGQNNIIFLINNGRYRTEAATGDGPLNLIKNWNYTGLVEAIHNGDGLCWTAKISCEEDLTEAIKTATGSKKECLCFIEVTIQDNDP